ncbi:MAG: efflux RND transporter permease subunit, partial [Candidatus Krumholzibacteria bacterium]|nr:efflux RND transporter permease subunit [Candidatus Krumholzibacteria bacterium]
VWMVTLAAVVFGLTSLGRLDMRLLPEIRYPSLTVQTDFPGTAPVDVENLVTRPLEEAMGVVPGLRKVHSISQAGLSQITLEFNWGTPMDYAALDVREKIDLVRLPGEASIPLLLKYDPSQDPVVRIGLSGDAALVKLRNVADDVLKKEIEALEGVAAAQVSGGLEEEIRVEVDETKLSSLGIDVATINRVLAEENINASGGRLRDRNAEYIVRTVSRFEDLADIENVTVAVLEGKVVKLGEVATVTRTHKERTTVTHIDGRESVEIAVFKEGDANIIEMAERVKAHLGRIESQLPDRMQVEVLFDQSTFIAQAISEVRNNALIGGALAVAVLFVFLRDFRSTLIIGIAIPISIVATFILMLTKGVSLNIMSLGGLALGVGMLVDNSIVVLESIHRRREEAPANADIGEVVAQGAGEVAGAVTASTLTTLAVFVPIVFVVVGVAGQIFRDQALTVTFSLAVSLVVALTFTPMAAAFGSRNDRRHDEGPLSWFHSWYRHATAKNRVARWSQGAGLFLSIGLIVGLIRLLKLVILMLKKLVTLLLWPATWLFEKTFPVLHRGYAQVLAVALRNRFAVLFLALLIAGGATLLWPRLGSELVPPLSRGEFTLAFELPEGTPLGRTESVIGDVEKDLAELSGIDLVVGGVGISREANTAAQRRKENRAEVQVKLTESTALAEAAVLEDIRGVLKNYPDLRMKVRRQSLMAFGAPVEVNVYGYSLTDLQATADQVLERLQTVPGLRDLRLGMVPGSPEVQVTFDRDKLNRYGLSLGTVSETVRGKVRGTVASRFRDRERHVDIRVLNRDEQRNTLTAVQDLIVTEVEGVPISLGTLAKMEVVTGPSEIHRLGSKRVAIVSANLSGRDLGSVTEDIRAQLAGLTLPAGVSVEMGGQNEEMDSSFRSLRMAILLAIFLVYLVMAAQFESFVYPLIIMFTVPLAMSGAVYGLYMRGMSVSVIAIIGAIMLAGIVVNNGIVLVDRINQLRLNKLHLAAAVVQAGVERLRPILMTTATTVLGLLPMAMGLGEGAELRAPLAVTVISGLLLATLLTLVVVPVVYTLLTGGERLRTEAAELTGAGRVLLSQAVLQTAGKDA